MLKNHLFNNVFGGSGDENVEKPLVYKVLGAPNVWWANAGAARAQLVRPPHGRAKTICFIKVFGGFGDEHVEKPLVS